MKSRAVLYILLILATILPLASAQDEITPISLEVKVYPDGSTLVTYKVESDPTKVRLDVPIFSDSFNNLIIRDEDGIPLFSTLTANGLTIDSIGASELNIIYATSDLTTKDGPIWNLNLTSPISTLIILPQGAAIFDLGGIPIDLGNINGAQYVELPAGEIYVSFLLSLPNLSGEAQATINEAESYMSSLENQDYILNKARSELTIAQQLFDTDQYIDAKNSANQAIETAEMTVQNADLASIEIALAENVIYQAAEEGRTDGLTPAQEIIASALTYYDQGLYVEAAISAKQASQLALSADEPSSGGTYLLFIALLLAVGAGGGYYYMQNIGKKESPTPPAIIPEIDEHSVDLEKLFRLHDGLRLEDREVIKFLAENNGEAFATEIRDRFDMPRSTAWRLIRRLVSLEIVNEVKVGNQSLVKICKKFLS